MDKLREFLGLLKRQHFWFLAPILLLMAAAGWWLSSKKLSAEFDTYKSSVDGYKRQMDDVIGKARHPNRDFHEGMENLIQQRRENVREAWQTKWERQKQELKWPDELPAEFRQQVEQMRPIEKVNPELNPQQEIPASLRRTYGGFIKNELPKLATSIGSEWRPQRVGGGRALQSFGSPSRRGESRNEEGDVLDESQIVAWNPANQGLFDQRFDWGTRPPSTREVLYAQEDLWVLSTVIDIIRRTNRDAPTRSQAAVKEIDFIQLANNVDPPSFKVLRPGPVVGQRSATSDDDDASVPSSTSSEPTTSAEDISLEGAEAGADASQEWADLVKNRYVNENYEPIADLSTLESLLTVAKRIPVRMRLKVDQRRINRLLVECANSPLTFEVRQFRLNPADDPLGAGRSQLGVGDTFRSEASIGMSNVKTLTDYQSFDRTVELFGIVYIFNPVNEQVLNGGQPDADAEADATDLALNVAR